MCRSNSDKATPRGRVSPRGAIACAMIVCVWLSGCRMQHHSTTTQESVWQRADSLVAIRNAALVATRMAQVLLVDSSRLVVTRYDTAGRVRERVEYQADRRTRQGEHAMQQLHTFDSVRAGQRQAWQARSSTERVSDVKGYPYAWVAYVLAGIGVAIVLSVLRGYLIRLLRG